MARSTLDPKLENTAAEIELDYVTYIFQGGSRGAARAAKSLRWGV